MVARGSRPLRADPIDLARQNWAGAGWPEVTDGMALVTSIMRIHQLLAARVEATLRPFDLTFARFEVLMLLIFSSRQQLPIGKIGERLQVHPASATNAVQRLAAAGLVERSTNPADGRSALIAPTDDGRRVAMAAAETLNRDVFADVGVDAGDERALFEMLRSWRHAYGDFE